MAALREVHDDDDTPFWLRPFAEHVANDKVKVNKAVVRAPKTMLLEPQQPVVVQFPMSLSRFNRCPQWVWEAATLDVSNECITGNDEEDFSSIKLSARSIVAAHQSDEINTPMMTQVLMNPTNERLWVPEGTILGWVEEAPDILSIQEVLR